MKSDEQIRTDVTRELEWDPAVGKPAGIGVAVRNGVVTLSGQVETFFQKRAVEQASRRVAGVRGIAMDLEVHFAGGNRLSDADIAQAALDAMRLHSVVPADRVTVEVDGGNVTLVGEVDWSYQRDSAEASLWPLAGVKNVSNKIRIRPHASGTDIAAQIVSAFTRHAQREAGHLAVEVSGGVVTLRGKVDSLRERDAAIGTAWCAKGVTGVVDQIQVGA